jgi:hypothetical protein
MERLVEKWKKAEYRKKAFFCMDSLLILCVINWYWFDPLKEKIFLIGDDIRFYNIVKSSDNIVKTMLTNDAGIYRPVSYLVMAIVAKLLGTNSNAYFQFNVIFNTLIILSIYKIVYTIAEKNKFYLAFLGSFLYVVAVYSYYGITQLLGLMEQMCVFFCVWFFYFIMKYIKYRNQKDYICSVLIYLLVLLSHERFLTLLGVYIVLNFLILYDRNIKIKVKNMAIASIPAIYFIVMKVYILNVKLFVGTGQVAIEFSVGRTIEYIGQSILSMLGILVGPGYLMGHLFGEFNKIDQIMILITVILLIACFGVYVYQCIIKNKMDKKEELQKLFAFIFIEGATIVCYSVSSRIEMRQIYVPYVVFIIYVMYCVSKINVSFEAISTISLFCAVIIGINAYVYRQNTDSLFFFRAMSFGKSGYGNTIAMNEDIEDYKLYIEENGELTWAMLLSDEKDIFYMYDKEVEWERFEDLDILQQNVEDDVKSGKKVKILYVIGNGQVAAIDYVDENQQIDVKTQMGR